MKRSMLPVAGLVLGLTLAACGQGETTPAAAEVSVSATPSMSPQMQSLYDQAKTEGSVVIYGPSQDHFRKSWDVFEKQFPGVTVKTENLFGPKLNARMEAERKAGGPRVDIIYLAPPELTGFIERDWLAPYKPAGGEGLPERYTGPDDLWNTPTLQVYPVVYNTQLVKSADVPKTYADLLQPEWEGKVGISDPTVGAATAQVFIAAMDAGKIDEPWLKNFAQQKPKTYPSSGNLLQAVASGQVAIGIQNSYAKIKDAISDGAPIAFTPLDGGMLVADFCTALVKGAPHPAAAKLLMEWTYTDAGQEALATYAGFYGSEPGTMTPKGAPELGSFDNWKLPYATQLKTELPQRLTLFKGIFS